MNTYKHKTNTAIFNQNTHTQTHLLKTTDAATLITCYRNKQSTVILHKTQNHIFTNILNKIDTEAQLNFVKKNKITEPHTQQ